MRLRHGHFVSLTYSYTPYLPIRHIKGPRRYALRQMSALLRFGRWSFHEQGLECASNSALSPDHGAAHMRKPEAGPAPPCFAHYGAPASVILTQGKGSQGFLRLRAIPTSPRDPSVSYPRDHGHGRCDNPCRLGTHGSSDCPHKVMGSQGRLSHRADHAFSGAEMYCACTRVTNLMAIGRAVSTCILSRSTETSTVNHTVWMTLMKLYILAVLTVPSPTLSSKCLPGRYWRTGVS